jgi:putative salt-induced outer membrane protein YdiY
MHNHLFGYISVFILLCSVTASAEIIALKNGDSIHVVVKDETDSQLTVEHQSLGTLSILREQIVSINHKQEDLPEDKVTAIPTADRGMFNTGLLTGWERSIEMGLDGSAGVSQSETLRLGLELKYEDDKDRWRSNTIFYLDRSEHETSEQKTITDLTKDWLLKDSKWFYYSHSGFDWDKFKDWDYRIRQYGGIGYQFIKNEKWDVLGRLGLGATHTIGTEISDETTAEAPVGFAIKRNIKDKHTMECRNIFFPSLTNVGEHRNVTDVNWDIKFDYLRGFGLKVGVYNEYDSTETSKNDLDYYASLTWDF